MRSAVGSKRDHFAVEDRFTRSELSDRLHDFRHRRRDVAKVACEHADVIAALVDLNARAIQLPLERHVTAKLIECLVHVIGRLRQHRLNRLKELDTETSQPGSPATSAALATGASVPAIITARRDGGRADVGCPGDGIDEDRFERPLPQLACQQADDEVLFRACGLPKKFAKPLVAQRPLRRRP